MEELDHETLLIQYGFNRWDFCKTARKPYDLLVCACLIAATDYLGYDVSSDGRFKNWKPAIDFYLKTIYGKMPDEETMKKILPEFLFEGQNGDEYEKPYSVMDYVKSLFVEV